jgi:ABC-type uncharacterized transport system substrate-binding protein
MTVTIGRRELLAALGGAAAVWPLAARTQQAAKLPTIGFLGADASNWSLWTAAFAARLRELGWSEGRTIAIEYRWSEGRAQSAAEIAAEFVRLEAAAHAQGIEVAPLRIRRAQDIATAFESLNPQADALYVVQDAVVVANRTAIVAFALTRRLPTIFSAREFVQAGGLLSYGPNYPGMFRRAADYVDKIMRGAKPSDLPIEQPTKFDLIINLTIARALGVAVPEKLLALADEVIE